MDVGASGNIRHLPDSWRLPDGLRRVLISSEARLRPPSRGARVVVPLRVVGGRPGRSEAVLRGSRPRCGDDGLRGYGRTRCAG
jgi:hypothetical protein